MINNKINLSISDQKRLKQFIDQISTSVKLDYSLNSLLNKWRIFVNDVGNGYNNSVYEYTNSLGVRDILEKAINLLSKDGQNEINQNLNPLDTIFKESTDSMEQSISHLKVPGEFWWWYRIPKNPGDELKRDLQSEGFFI